MTTRNSARARRVCWDAHHRLDEAGKPYLICHECGVALKPPHDRWQADHIARWAEGGQDTADNLRPACEPCHRLKSARDTTEVAKGKRVGARHYGITASDRPMPGSRGSGWKKRMDGTVVRR